MDATLEIIIPIYNEGTSIQKVYAHLIKALDNQLSWKAFFVYDFDEDTTVPFLKDIQSHDPRIIPLKQNFGKGVVNALKFGFTQVHDGAVAVVMGDDSDDLEKLPLMLQKYQEGAVVVAASRHSTGGHYQGGSAIKKNLSKMAGFILDKAGIGTRDPTNNFKLYCGKFLRDTKIESTGGFEVALELTVKAAAQGLKVTEIPSDWQDREAGKSKFKIIRWMPHYLKWFFYYFYKKFLLNKLPS
jgi:glycosyltransferase involved in cell wall biosynthesis